MAFDSFLLILSLLDDDFDIINFKLMMWIFWFFLIYLLNHYTIFSKYIINIY